MRAARINHEQTIRRAIHPNAVFLLPFSVNPEPVIRWISDFETCCWFKQCSRKKKPEEGDKPGRKEGRDRRPRKPPAAAINFIVLRTDCRHAARSRCFRSSDCGSANVPC